LNQLVTQDFNHVYSTTLAERAKAQLNFDLDFQTGDQLLDGEDVEESSSDGEFTGLKYLFPTVHKSKKVVQQENSVK
jgi:hypothetical protein